MANPIGFQVTVDAGDPDAQARFWAAALQSEVEDQDAFIRGLLDQGHADEGDVLGWTGGSRSGSVPASGRPLTVGPRCRVTGRRPVGDEFRSRTPSVPLDPSAAAMGPPEVRRADRVLT